MTLCRTRFTSPAPQWRLTCVWESSRHHLRHRKSGLSSADVGALLQAGGGADSSEIKRGLSSTTLTSESKLDDYERMTWDPEKQ